jgi:hypothetical protein
VGGRGTTKGNRYSAEQRFMLLLAIALAALTAMGAFLSRGVPGIEAEAVGEPPHARTAPGAASGSRPPVDVDPLPYLGAHAIALDQQFPRLSLRPAAAAPLLSQAQIVSYYGNPHTPALGVLGAADIATVAAQLRAQAERYDVLNGPTEIVPALHLVYAVAQPHPTGNGRYLQYADDVLVLRYLAFVEEHDLLLFLDLQIGRGTVEEELRRVLPYLRHPRVHLALDPEFAVGPGKVPGDVIGSLTAADINSAQRALRDLTRDETLPAKLLVVHQFLDSMILDGGAIERFEGVELIIDMDGFGPAEVKRSLYRRYALRPYATHAGVKLFFEYDTGLMSEADVLALQPPPKVIIYQ